MADIEIWGPSVSLITTPGATDRVVFATGSGAGGYSERGDFAWRTSGGYLIASSLADTSTPAAGVVDSSSATFLTNQAQIYGLNIGISVTGGAWLQGQRSDGLTALYPISLNPLGGNVGIGNAAPLYAADIQVANPDRGIIAQVFNKAVATPNGAMIAYGNNGINIWSMGMLPNANAFGLYIGRALGSDGVLAAQWDSGANYLAGADNVRNLGSGALRWATVYAGTGAINTCDIRLKFYRAEPALTPDEHAAVLECFDAFGFFQHLDAVGRENAGGSPARWHFGPKAQEVWTIFANHGLAAPLGHEGLPPEGSLPPAFLCFDAWGEETAPALAWWRPSDILGPDGQPVMVPCAEGEEGTEQRPTGETVVVRAAGNIFGIRIDQLQSLMLVALNKERKDHASRIAALEAA